MKASLKVLTALSLAAAFANAALAQTPVTVRVLTLTAPANMPEINAQFEKENPGIKLDFQIVPDPQYGDVIRARLAGGDAPDVFGGHARSEMTVWQKSGYIEDLSKEAWVATLNPGPRTLASIDGKVYQFPVGGDGLGFFVNLDLLAKVNAKIPTNFTQFKATLTKLKAAGVRPLLVGFKDNFSSLIWSSMAASNLILTKNPEANAALVSGKANFDSAPWRGVLKQMRDLQGFYDNKTALGLGGFDEVKNEFLAGRVAFIPYGTWAVQDIKKAAPNLKFAVIPYPGNRAGTQPTATVIANAAVMVSATSKVKDAAKKYVAFLARPDIYRKYATGASLLSSVKGVRSDLADEINPLAEAIAVGRGSTFLPQAWGGDTQTPWTTMLGKYFANNLSESEALKGFEKDFRVEMAK